MDRASPPSPKLIVPDLGIPHTALTLSLWLVPEGVEVLEGDRIAELLTGAATIDLEAPVTGRLVRQLVDEDAAVTPGMAIAEFESAAE